MEREEWLGSNGVHLWGTPALPDEVENLPPGVPARRRRAGYKMRGVRSTKVQA